MYNIFFILIVAFLLIETGITILLSWLNDKYMRMPIPEELKGLYDESTYAKQQSYTNDKKRVERILQYLSFTTTLVILFTGTYGLVDEFTHRVADTPLLAFLFFAFIGVIVSTIVSLPFELYSTFVIEEKYGFNKTTVRTFWGDFVKSLILSSILIGVLASSIFLLYEAWGADFWIFALLVITGIYLFFALFYSHLIVPLFNKQTPLEPGELRTRIEALAQEVGFSVKNIYLIDGSKHSTKANAYFTGLGKLKRVVLYDTLLEQLTTDEIIAVLAHEFGHCKHNDQYKQMAVAIPMIALNLFVLSIFIGNPNLSIALGGSEASFALSLIAFMMLYTPIDIITSPFIGELSRKAEYAADDYAAKLGHGESLISGLKKLTANNLTPLTLHPWYIKFYLSHPTLLQRMWNINKKQTL